MPRPQIHAPDTILDAARALVLERGLAAATIGKIAGRSGAPTGSIYHHFGSRDDLLAEMWIRAVYRSQETILDAAAAEDDPLDAAVAAALAVYDFCDQHPADARLLLAFRREDLLRNATAPELVRQLEELNRPVEHALRDLARRLYGRATPTTVDRVLLAVFDLPHGAVRRPLIAGARLSATRRHSLEASVRAALMDR